MRWHRDLSDTPLLDFGVESYADLMSTALEDLDEAGVMDQLDALGVEGKEAWIAAVGGFEEAASQWRTRFESMKEEAGSNPLMARALSDQVG